MWTGENFIPEDFRVLPPLFVQLLTAFFFCQAVRGAPRSQMFCCAPSALFLVILRNAEAVFPRRMGARLLAR